MTDDKNRPTQAEMILKKASASAAVARAKRRILEDRERKESSHIDEKVDKDSQYKAAMK